MDDCCAVCAEPLEWVAYGQCGHKDVCSTCVARLRFICEDRRCCICKTESDVVFITKALGDYTRNISDFTVFPSDSTEGKVGGSFWFHEDMRAYFDDSDHYKMIKAMCRLTCSECDKMEEQGGNEGGPKRKGKFRNIEQLKGHLFHQHRLFMCGLCLEGRKIFICEQKLYSRAQLNQHINTGDSEVDGSESERGGFMGHPMCDFCRKPFYGDNELYTHMSTEHFTCHICKRQNPGQFDYFKNYDDLEVHFRQQHFLCEDESCLAKKFIVFPSESEMKRHNAIEHGGNMSRAKRNAVLQIPTSFQYRRNNEQDSRRGRGGRGRGSYPDSSDNQLSQAIQASFETANYSDDTIRDPSANAQVAPSHGEISGIDDIVGSMESLATTDAELSARYLQAVSHGPRNGRLEESSFPPLLTGSGNGQQNSQNDSVGLGKNTMAARLRRRNKGTVSVLNSAQPWGKTSRGQSSSSSSAQSRLPANFGPALSSSSASSAQSRLPANFGPALSSSSASSAQSRLPANFGPALSSSSASSSQTKPAVATTNGPVPSSYASTAQASAFPSGSTWNSSSSASRVSHSVSAPNLVERGSLDSSSFPPVLATRKDKLSTSNKPVERGPLDSSNFPPVLATRKENVSSSNGHVVKVEDVQTANKSLVERMRSALDFDENKFTAFKEISGEFRQGVIETSEYLSYVQQFGLSHLVLELARLCPDTQKQRELIETYNASVRHDNAQRGKTALSVSNGSNKGKGKRKEEADNSLTDSILSTVRKLQANYKPSEDEVEVLSKDGYRKGKTIAEVPMGVGASSVNRKQTDSNVYNDSSGVASNKNASGGGKQKKKISKFHRVRLGDGSAAAYLDSRNSDNEEDATDVKQSPSEGLPVRGAWRNGGGQKLVAMTQRGSPK